MNQAVPVPLAQLAFKLIESLDGGTFLKSTSDVCTMPDLLTCLALGWAPPQFIKELSSVDVSFSPSAFLRKAGSAVVDALSSTLVSEHKRSVQQLLIRLCIPQDTPHPWDDCTAVFCLRGAHMQFW